jgi:hypothetical protein
MLSVEKFARTGWVHGAAASSSAAMEQSLAMSEMVYIERKLMENDIDQHEKNKNHPYRARDGVPVAAAPGGDAVQR